MMVFFGSVLRHRSVIACHLAKQERPCVRISDILIHRSKLRLLVTVHVKDAGLISLFQTQIKNGTEHYFEG